MRPRPSSFPSSSFPSGNLVALVVVLSVMLDGALAGTSSAQDELGVPDRRVQRRELKELREQHADAYRNRSREAMADLADDLRDASETLEPAARYVHLEEARTLAVAAGEVKLAFEIAESLATAFVVDRFELLGTTAKDLARGVASRDELVEVGRRTLKLVTEAAEAERYEGGARIASVVESIARKAGDRARRERAMHFQGQLAHLARLHAAMSEARRELLNTPDAPDPHLAVALYLAVARCDLEKSIPHLARVADERLRRVAEAERKPPVEPAAKLALARSWEELIDAEHALSENRQLLPYRWHFLARAIRDRALYWYREARDDAGPVERVEIDARIAAWGATEPSNVVGGDGGGRFDDATRGPGLLIGVRYSIAGSGPTAVIGSIKPMFRTPHGEVLGPIHRGRSRGAVDLIARPGYAVGGVRAAGTNRLETLRLIFMKVNGPGLDPADSYLSEPIGGSARAVEETIHWGGVPAIGIHGREGADIDALGLLYQR